MGRHFAATLFTPAVQAEQERVGSRRAYASQADRAVDDSRLGPAEAAFIEARDSFFLASISSSGWPYIQHRGGPAGFVRVLDEGRIAFADYAGNKQHITSGNLADDDRVSLIFVDFANRRRLKLIGRARRLEADDPLVLLLRDGDYAARIEGAILIEVVGFDWNCPQHITRRWSEAELAAMVEA